jgi:iron complex transport system substrate-binding protein
MSLVLCARLFCCFLISGWHGSEAKLAGKRGRQIPAALAWVAIFAVIGQSAFRRVASASWPRAERVAQAQSGAQAATDEVGRRVAIPSEVRRIVSLAPNLTESLYALGLEDRLVGDTDYCDMPPEAKRKPHIGSPVNPSLEAIVGLRPDLVFATTSINRRETVDALARLRIPVYATDPHTIRAMVDSFGRMADLVGAPEKGAALVAKLDATLDSLHARLRDLPAVHVLFVVWLDPLISIGQNTFIADALRWAGAESVVLSRLNWPQLNLEEAVRLQPDYIVLAESHTGEGSRTLQDLRGRAAWRALEAVQLGHVALVSEEIDRPAPGLIGVIEQLARELHPSAFGLNPGPRAPAAEILAPDKWGVERRLRACVR